MYHFAISILQWCFWDRRFAHGISSPAWIDLRITHQLFNHWLNAGSTKEFRIWGLHNLKRLYLRVAQVLVPSNIHMTHDAFLSNYPLVLSHFDIENDPWQQISRFKKKITMFHGKLLGFQRALTNSQSYLMKIPLHSNSTTIFHGNGHPSLAFSHGHGDVRIKAKDCALVLSKMSALHEISSTLLQAGAPQWSLNRDWLVGAFMFIQFRAMVTLLVIYRTSWDFVTHF